MQTYDVTIRWSVNDHLRQNDDQFEKNEFHNPTIKVHDCTETVLRWPKDF